MVTRVPRFSASLREPCTPTKGWRPAAATVVHGPALPLGVAGLRVQRDPGAVQLGAAAGDGARRAGNCVAGGLISRMHLRTGAVLGEFWESRGEQHTE